MPPTALIDALQGVRRRVRLLSVLYGAGIVIASVAGLLLTTVLLDYTLNLPPAPRMVVMAVALLAAGRLLARWIVRPAVSKIGLADLAGRLERAFPAFDDRLRSTIDFTSHEIPGSAVMKDRVMSEAADLAAGLDLTRALYTQPLWRSLAAAGGALAVVVLLGAMAGHEYFDTALSRLLNPFQSRAWPKRVQIEMVGDLPQRVAAGQRVDVRIRLARGDRPSREAQVFYQYGSGTVQREIMTRGADGVYSAALDARADTAPAAANTMKIWTQAGDDATAPKTVAVVPRLAITGVELSVAPPAYAGESAYTAPLETTPVTVVYGSNLALKLTFNKNLDAAQPIILESADAAGPAPAIVWDGRNGSAAFGHWAAVSSTTFHIHAIDTDGLSNADMTDYQVIVRPDQPPTVQITRPAHNEECTPQAVIPLRAMAEDDFGIRSLKLVAVRLGEKPTEFTPIDLIQDSKPAEGVTWNRLDSAGDIHRWQLDFPWDLARLDSALLKNGDVIEYHLEAQDNFDFQGQRHDAVSSGHYRITIMSQDQFTSLMGDLMSQVRQQLIDIHNDQTALKEQTADLRKETQKQSQFSRADLQQAAQLVERQATAASQARQAAQRLDDILQRMQENRSSAADLKEIASSTKEDLNQVAEHPMKEAAAGIDNAKTEQTDARNDDLDTAQSKQQAAAEKLDQLVSRLGEASGLPEAIRDLKEIQQQQRDLTAKSDEIGMRNLGKQPDQMQPGDAKAQQDNAAAQNNLADKMQKAIEQLATRGRKLEKSDPASAQAMQQAAQTGRQQDVVSQMHNSADQQKQNQQGAAQQAQAQIEVGLQMMMRELEQAERARLEELSRRLADIQQQLQELVRQQASLNYENLSLQGGQTLKKIDAKVIDGLLGDAQWSANQIPPVPDVGTQTRLQEQTEHNARSVGTSAASLPGGAQIVAALGRAADRMGRAITFLRDDESADTQRLISAYDPSQVEALTALRMAKDIVDQEAQKNAETLNQQKRDTIRAAYEKILEAQKKIDVDTVTIDHSPRTSDGQLSHRQTIRLAQLPPEQAGLVERTGKLEDDLSALGSIVYVWANKDIADSMRHVGNDLAAANTGTATQAEQTRIEEQVQAMIDSLKVKPKQMPFAQKGGGKGSGGSGQPTRLPPEAELRLLKRLQESVNKATKTINDQGNPQDPALVALGGRQGELRNLLGQLLERATGGHFKIGPEPAPSEKLPEEAAGDKDDAELEHALLTDTAPAGTDQAGKDINLIGRRMGRVRQRLAVNHDPGQTTQEIQKGIVQNMDTLIDMARQQQAESSPSPSNSSAAQQASTKDPGVARQPSNTGNGNQSANQTGGHTAAAVHTGGHDVDSTHSPTTDITQSLKEWGALSPRKRAAIVEAASEKPIEKFKGFIDDYYRALGARSGEQGEGLGQGEN